MFRLLVVDDEPAIRDMLQQSLQACGWRVDTAFDGVDALEKLELAPYEMLLSDINMPRMGGFELFQLAEKRFPIVKRVLMSSYNLDDYMRMVRDHNIGNVIAKSAPINFKEIRELITALLNNSIFGLDQYMLSPHTKLEYHLVTPSQIEDFAESICKNWEGTPVHTRFKVVLFELMTNALFYGARNERGDRKEDWERQFQMPENESVIVTTCVDREKVGVSVLDRGGKLDKHTVLYWLDRQTTHDERGLPQGVFDFHGRGFFITRKYVDRFLINIEKGIRCECCVFNYFETKLNHNKPLIINEI